MLGRSEGISSRSSIASSAGRLLIQLAEKKDIAVGYSISSATPNMSTEKSSYVPPVTDETLTPPASDSSKLTGTCTWGHKELQKPNNTDREPAQQTASCSETSDDIETKAFENLRLADDKSMEPSPGGTIIAEYQPVVRFESIKIERDVSQRVVCITCMDEYKNKSTEELRWEDYQNGIKKNSAVDKRFGTVYNRYGALNPTIFRDHIECGRGHPGLVVETLITFKSVDGDKPLVMVGSDDYNTGLRTVCDGIERCLTPRNCETIKINSYDTTNGNIYNIPPLKFPPVSPIALFFTKDYDPDTSSTAITVTSPSLPTPKRIVPSPKLDSEKKSSDFNFNLITTPSRSNSSVKYKTRRGLFFFDSDDVV